MHIEHVVVGPTLQTLETKNLLKEHPDLLASHHDLNCGDGQIDKLACCLSMWWQYKRF